MAVLTLLVAAATWLTKPSFPGTEAPFEVKRKPPEPAPLCPWREPEADLKKFFPDATRCKLETRILSGLRVELAERLGRAPGGDENVLHVNQVFRDQTPLGCVLTRRVKGSHGAIEIVLAVDSGERVVGLRLQRLREPEPAAGALGNPDWLHSFEGRGAHSAWKCGEDISRVVPEAQASADAIVEGARSLLILLTASNQNQFHSPVPTAHH